MILYFYTANNSTTKVNTSSIAETPNIRFNGIYIFQFSGRNKLGSNVQITNMLIFLSDTEVCQHIIDEVLAIDRSQIQGLLNEIKSKSKSSIDNLGKYTKIRNLATLSIPGPRTTTFLEGMVLNDCLLLNIDLEYVDYSLGDVIKERVFDNAKFKFIPA